MGKTFGKFNVNFFFFLFILAWPVEFTTEGHWEFAQWAWEEKEGNADNRAEVPRNNQLLGKPGMFNLINKTVYGELWHSTLILTTPSLLS